jgi:hypothetical protein
MGQHLKSDRYVVLPAKGRKARIGKRAVVVTVGLGFAKRGYGGAVYRRPEVQFSTIGADGEVAYGRVTMGFQTHIAGMGSDASPHDKRGPGGFLRMGSGEWVGCYGGDITSEFSYPGHAATLCRVLDLVNRAREVRLTPSRHGSSRGCDLLALLIGLQRIGVEVRIQREGRVRYLERLAA